MFIGDFNTGKHHLDEVGATFFHPEYIVMMEERDWLDAWRALHPDAREYSWFSAAGNGFRVDHAYVSPMLQPRVLAARYSHDERLERISDHSILIIELDATGLNIR